MKTPRSIHAGGEWGKIRALISAFFIAWMSLVSACGRGTSLESTLTPTRTSQPRPILMATPTSTPRVISGTVTIWHSWEDAYLPALLRRIAAFQEIYPSVQFDVRYIPAIDLRASFEQAASEGWGPTLLLAPAGWGPQLYEKGMVADLSPMVGAEVLEPLNPSAVDCGRYGQALLSLPVDVRGVVLYRNRRIIPEAPATWENLLSQAKAATQGKTFGAMFDRSFFFSGAHLYGIGGQLMTAEGLPAFNDASGLRWINLLQSFDQAGAPVFASDEDLTRFEEGNVGMIVEGTWNRQALAEAIGAENLAIDPWPLVGEGTLSGFIQSEGIYLTPRALEEEHEISWMFLKFFLAPESQAMLAEVGLVPALSGSPLVWASQKVRIDDPLIAQAMLALMDGTAYPTSPLMGIYSSQMDIALKSIFEGGVPAEQALQTAQNEILAALSAENVTPTP